MYEVSALFLYSGYGDYWSGDGERWEDNKGCLFFNYNHTTTLPELIEGWMEDMLQGGDLDSMTFEIEDSQIKQALIDMLSDEGKAEYDLGDKAPIAGIAKDFLSCNFELAEMNDEQLEEFYEEGDLPQAIVLIRVEEPQGEGT